MNLSSAILLLILLSALAYGIYKIKDSKGACEDCSVATCPVHENGKSKRFQDENK